MIMSSKFNLWIAYQVSRAHNGAENGACLFLFCNLMLAFVYENQSAGEIITKMCNQNIIKLKFNINTISEKINPIMCRHNTFIEFRFGEGQFSCWVGIIFSWILPLG